MVREVICLQVGQCGNQIGSRFWEAVFAEHKLDKKGREKAKFDPEVHGDKIDVYFKEQNGRGPDHNREYKSKSSGKWIQRAVMVDLEPGTLDVVTASAVGAAFKPDNFVFGNSGAGNNWAKGHYTEGAEIVEQAIDVVRKEAEGSDHVQGFQIAHSLGGGTGSGLGTLLLLKIRDAYPDRLTKTYSVYPSPKVSDTVVEPYNSVLATHQLLENADQTFVIDNEALYSISVNLLKEDHPTYSFLNYLISQVQMGCTASIRFSGKLNGDLRKLGVNMIPFPRLHFFNIAQAPILSPRNKSYTKLFIQELTKQVWSGKQFFSNVPIDDGKFLTGSLTYRGPIETQEVDENVEKVQSAKAEEFVEWIPNNIKSSVIDTPPVDSAISCTFITNTTALKAMFQRLASQFSALYKRKAFLHWYKGEGMDEMEFQEADKNVVDLITEYQDKQDATVGGDEDEDMDEE